MTDSDGALASTSTVAALTPATLKRVLIEVGLVKPRKRRKGPSAG